MDLNRWKRFKRSGAYRRKVSKEYMKLMKEPESSQVLRGTGTGQTGSSNMVGGSAEKETCCSSGTDITSSDDSEREFDYENFVEYENNLKLREDIKIWAIKCNISHSTYNELAVILNKNGKYFLPKDARTLLQTTGQEIQIAALGTGNYWHNGLIKQLRKHLEHFDYMPNNISLNINIDGLPLYKSSRKQFWPILCSIFEVPCLPPLVIGKYMNTYSFKLRYFHAD